MHTAHGTKSKLQPSKKQNTRELLQPEKGLMLPDGLGRGSWLRRGWTDEQKTAVAAMTLWKCYGSRGGCSLQRRWERPPEWCRGDFREASVIECRIRECSSVRGKSKKEERSVWPSVSEGGDPQAKQRVTQYEERGPKASDESPKADEERGPKADESPKAEGAEAEAPPPKIRDGKRYGLRPKAPAPAKAEEAPAPAPAPAPTTTGLNTHVHRPDAKPASAPRALSPGPGTNTTSTSSQVTPETVEVRNSRRRGAVAAAVQPVRTYPAGATPPVTGLPPWRQPQMGSTMAMGVAAMATAPATVGTAPAEMPPMARIPMPKWAAPPAEIPMPKFAAPHPEPQPEEVARAEVITAEERRDWPEWRLRVVADFRIRMRAQSKDKAD